jgi:two-component system NarL family sensor kinase
MTVRAAWVFLYDGATGEFRLAADVSLPAPLALEGKRRMAGDCRCNQMLREGRFSEAINLIQCARLEQALPNEPTAQQHATVPLMGQDGAVGILNLLLPTGRAFSDDDLDLLGAVGHELAVAIQRAQLFEQVRDHEHVRRQLLQRLLRVQEEERRRIAQDLHDHSGQMLTAMTIRLDQLQAAFQQDGTVRKEDLVQIKALGDRLWEGLRRLIYDLRPPILDDLGLAAAVRGYSSCSLRPGSERPSSPVCPYREARPVFRGPASVSRTAGCRRGGSTRRRSACRAGRSPRTTSPSHPRGAPSRGAADRA